MAPPAKRRRRNLVDDSDDDADQPRTNTLANYLVTSPTSNASHRPPTVSPSPVKTGAVAGDPLLVTPTKKTRRAPPRTTGAALSPRKTRAGGKADEQGKTADLKTLFSKQAQRVTRTGPANDRPPIDDIISDPVSEDEISELQTSSSSVVGQHARKRLRKGGEAAPAEAPSSSQRFLRPPRAPGLAANDDDLRPWSERFGPRNLDELAVHKKKVADVRRWLEDVMAGRIRQRILILKGAAGSGKTTTVRLLARDMGCELLEWKNPSGSSALGFVSTSAQFDDFLGRGGKFGALELEGVGSSAPGGFDGAAPSQTKRIILVEEFPNTFSRSSSALASFRNSILQYLAAHASSPPPLGRNTPRGPITPIVLAISETLLTTTSASADSLTAHRLLGPEILRHGGVTVIEFNPIAPSILTKALELIVQKEARKSGRRRTPGPLVLKRLGEIGDIRNALSSLEFLCLKGDQEVDWGGKVTFTRQKRGVRDAIGLTKGEAESLESVSQREASLGIFHAVGKVVYNKREEASPPGDTVEILAAHLAQHARPKRSLVAVDDLIDEMGTDTSTFISALHENYILSCESTGPMDLSTPMDYVNECIEYLSLGDLLSPSRDVFFGGSGSGFSGRDSGSYQFRQDEMTFQVAVRGILFSLPQPVKRKTTSSKGSDAFKMFYPTALKLWREKEELESLVELWSSKLLKGEQPLPSTQDMTDGAKAFRKPQASLTEASWRRQRQQPGATAAARATGEVKEVSQDTAPPVLSLGSVARREMLLERLPYMAHVVRGRRTGETRLRDLDRVVSFRGVSAPTDDESDADDDTGVGPGEAWATDRPSEEATPRKKRAGIRAGGVSGLLAQKLVLSDDDIED